MIIKLLILWALAYGVLKLITARSKTETYTIKVPAYVVRTRSKKSRMGRPRRRKARNTRMNRYLRMTGRLLKSGGARGARFGDDLLVYSPELDCDVALRVGHRPGTFELNHASRRYRREASK